LNLTNFNFYRKSKAVKDESDEEAEVKNNIVVGVNIPNETQNIKRKLPTNSVLKNSIKKKKSLSNNWKVSENV